MADSTYTTRVTADPTGFEAGMKRAMAAASEASRGITGQFQAIGDKLELVTKGLAVFTAVLAGGTALKDFISATVDWNAEALLMSQRLGITTEQASILNVALDHLGIDSNTYNDAAGRMSKQIQGNAAAFEVMGVKVRDATGAYRPVTEVMQEVNEKLLAQTNPIAQNIAGQQVYGKGWESVRSILKLTASGMTDAEETARSLGLIVGPEGAAQTKLYSEQLRDVGLITKSLEIQIGNALMPTLITLGQWMGEEGPAMGKVFATVLTAIGFAAAATWLTLKDMGDSLGALAAQGVALLHGDLAGARAIGAARDEEAAKNEAAFEKLKADFAQPIPVAGLDFGKGTDWDNAKPPNYHFPQHGDNKHTKPPPSQMGDWEAQLAEQKLGEEKLGADADQFRSMSLADEAAFWRDKANQYTTSIADSQAANKKADQAETQAGQQKLQAHLAQLQADEAATRFDFDEKIKIEQQIQAMYEAGTKGYADSQKKINELQLQQQAQDKAYLAVRVQAERDAQLATIAIEEQASQTSLALGTITQAQALAADTQFEMRRNAIAKAALQQRLRDAKLGDSDPVAVAKIDAQLEALEQQHQAKLTQIESLAVINRKRYETDFFNTMQSNMTTSFTNIFNGTTTLSNGIKGIFVSIGQTLAQTAAKMVSDWLIAQVKMRLASKATSLAALNNDALTAAGKAYNAIVGIPFIGPFLAPAAAVVAYAGVMAFGAGISAAGGYDIPGNINPIVQTHAREMVLPAKHADVIRNLADNAGQASASSSGGSPIHIHTQGGDFVHVDDLAALLKKQHRNFKFA